jgi:hypothetical protein
MEISGQAAAGGKSEPSRGTGGSRVCTTMETRMKFLIPLCGLATLVLLPQSPAQAQYAFPKLNAPSLVETAACRTRQVRTVHPNGRVSYRTIRDCGPSHASGCRVVTTRTHRPDGAVVVKKVRRCG